jgi:hypothetical protein
MGKGFCQLGGRGSRWAGSRWRNVGRRVREGWWGHVAVEGGAVDRVRGVVDGGWWCYFWVPSGRAQLAPRRSEREERQVVAGKCGSPPLGDATRMSVSYLYIPSVLVFAKNIFPNKNYKSTTVQLFEGALSPIEWQYVPHLCSIIIS